MKETLRSRLGSWGRSRGDGGFVLPVVVSVILVAVGPGNIRAQDFLREVRPLSEGRQMHGSAVLGDYLYVFSGFTQTGNSSPSVMKAPIAADGSLGPWTATTPLPTPRLYVGNSTLVLNDTVYILCGSYDPVNPRTHNTVLFTRPQTGGDLMPWQESAPLPTAGSSTMTAVATPGYLHVIGGLSDSKAMAEVWSIGVNSDGSLRAWEPGPALPQAIWYHQAATVGGRVFVWGGINGGSDSRVASTQVFSAPILGSGKLGSWGLESSQLPAGFYGASVAVAGAYIINFSPRVSGGGLTNDIWWTFALPSGLDAWKRMPTQAPVKIYHAAATDYRRGQVYLNGGRPEREPKTPGAFNYCLRFGTQARAAAAQAWQGSQPTASAADSAASADAAGGQTSSAYTYMAAQALPAEAVPGFRTIDQARQILQAGQAGKLIIYFTSRSATVCRQQNELLRAPQFATTLSQGNFAWVDIGDHPQEAQALGVWRVPTWVAYDASGREIGRQAGVMQPQQFQ